MIWAHAAPHKCLRDLSGRVNKAYPQFIRDNASVRKLGLKWRGNRRAGESKRLARRCRNVLDEAQISDIPRQVARHDA